MFDIDPSGLDEAVTRRDFLKVAGAVVPTSAFLTASVSTTTAQQREAGNVQLAPAQSRRCAIVIGITETNGLPMAGTVKRPGYLASPLNGAISFTEWLITNAKVDPSDITFLCNLKDDNGIKKPIGESNVPLREDVIPKQATRKEIISSIQSQYEQCYERLYFYFAGHGARIKGIPKLFINDLDCLFPCDYDKDSSKTITVQNVLESLQCCNARQQFFFFDACRAVQSEADCESFTLGKNNYNVYQYQAYSTTETCTVADTGEFTNAVLNVLKKGVGRSKQFYPEGRKYVVHWNGLYNYFATYRRPVVNSEARSNRMGGTVGNDVNAVTSCRPIVLLNSYEPVPPTLAVINEDDVDVVDFTLKINAASPPEGIKVVIQEERAGGKTLTPNVMSNMLIQSVVVKVRPRRYVVSVTAKALFDPQSPYIVDLCEANELIIRLVDPVQPMPSLTEDAHPTLGIESGKFTSVIRLERPDGSLAYDKKNKPIIGRGKLFASDIKPGTYYVNADLAHGSAPRKVIKIEDGEKKKFHLTMDSPTANESPWSGYVLDNVSDRFKSVIEFRGGVVDSEYDISTNLIQIARMSNGSIDWPRELNLASLGPAFGHESGISIILCVESATDGQAGERLARFEFALISLYNKEESQLKVVESQIPGVASVSSPVKPGPYRLRYKKKGADGRNLEQQAEFSVRVLKNRICQFVLTEEKSGRLHIRQFFPKVERAENAIRMALNEARSLDIIQENLADQRGGYPSLLLTEIDAAVGKRSDKRDVDPALLLIKLHINSFEADRGKLKMAANELLEAFPDFPDAIVALGTLKEAEAGDKKDGREKDLLLMEARGLYERALSNGFPVLLRFLKLLSSGAKRLNSNFQPQDQLTRLIEADENSLSPALWAIWRVKIT